MFQQKMLNVIYSCFDKNHFWEKTEFLLLKIFLKFLKDLKKHYATLTLYDPLKSVKIPKISPKIFTVANLVSRANSEYRKIKFNMAIHDYLYLFDANFQLKILIIL